MSIFEYDEEKELALLRQAEREVGVEIGELCKTISLVRKKSNKGWKQQEIVDLLEEKEELVQDILCVITSNSIACDEEVAKVLYKKTNKR